MITRYEIKKQGNEEVLYLYMNYDYEFAQELGSPNKKMTILSEVKNYIDKMKIKFKGKYIVLVIAGLAAITLAYSTDKWSEEKQTFTPNPDTVEIVKYETHLNKPLSFTTPTPEVKKEENKEEIKQTPSIKEEISSNSNTSKPSPSVSSKPIQDSKPSSNTSKPATSTNSSTTSSPTNTPTNNIPAIQPPIENQTMVTIYRSNGTVETMALETYLIGVVAAEMPASFHIEALKAQAIVARTYALNRIQDGKVLTDTISTQVYKDNNQLKKTWGNSFDQYYNKVKSAVTATKGMVITYQGKYIDAVFHSTSNGHTVDAIDVWGNAIPYLKSVASPFDTSASSFLKETTKQISDIEKSLGITITPNSQIEIVQKDENGRVIQFKIDEHVYSGVEIRNKLGLRSTDFDFSIQENAISFTTRGFGHGVGMSQYGAQGMANNGSNYSQIIKHYYTGVSIEKK